MAEIQNRDGQVQRVLVITLILNFAVSGGKILVGALTGALSITADGFHSLMDGASNLIGLIATKIAAKPADEGHPYGHRRFETIAALAVGVLLLITAWEIVGGAIERLQDPQPTEVTPLTFIVLIVTLGVNIFVSRYERGEGERLQSELLTADAANTSADVFVTLSVLVSMVLVSLGWTWVDPIAALIIVVLIVRAAWGVLSQTGGVLVDTAPYSSDELSEVAFQVPSVEAVIRARSRGTKDAAHIDIDVRVPAEMTAAQTSAIAEAIRQKFSATLAGVSEVEVHFEPRLAGEKDYALTARAHADALGLSTHEVRLSDTRDGKILEMHVEVPPNQTLGEAHTQVSQLEQDIRANLPEVCEVVTHIEPAQQTPEETQEMPTPKKEEILKSQALDVLLKKYPSMDWHDLRVSHYEGHGGNYALSLHVSLDADATVEQAHTLAEDAELLIRKAIPEFARVTIHTEPLDAV